MIDLDRNATASEARVARALVAAALVAGFTVSVCDGEEWTVKRSADAAAIVDALCSTDEDVLRFRRADGSSVGVVHLIWGNSGEELIADHSDNAEICALVGIAERAA